MPFYLRALNNKQRWHKSGNPAWLSPPEIPVHPLADLIPRNLEDHTLSLWYVESDKSNLKRIAAAISAGRERVDKFDYALFPVEVVAECGVTLTQAPGATPDSFANIHWHWDIVELTADNLLRVAKSMYANAEVSRVLPPEIRRLILQGITSGELQENKISTKLLAELKS